MKSLITITLFLISNYAFAGYGNNLQVTTGTKNAKPPYMDEIGIDEKLGNKINLDLEFVNQDGKKVKLKEFFGEKPVFLTLIYYNCPTLCSIHMDTLTKSFRNFEWDIGDKFEFVAVSIDPNEGPRDALQKRDAYFSDYGRPKTKDGWHFLTGNKKNIDQLAQQVGFKFKWDTNMKQWAHSSVAYVLTPQAGISYYHYGLNIDPKILRLSLVEASNNIIGNVVDRVVLFCLQYDPDKKTYAFYAFNIMRVGAFVLVIILIIFFVRFWRKENSNREEE
jgi:protein SCO1/2